jgi:hypothetical protein
LVLLCGTVPRDFLTCYKLAYDSILIYGDIIRTYPGKSGSVENLEFD